MNEWSEGGRGIEVGVQRSVLVGRWCSKLLLLPLYRSGPGRRGENWLVGRSVGGGEGVGRLDCGVSDCLQDIPTSSPPRRCWLLSDIRGRAAAAVAANAAAVAANRSRRRSARPTSSWGSGYPNGRDKHPANPPVSRSARSSVAHLSVSYKRHCYHHRE